MMDDYHKIEAELMRLERWQYVAFAAACAERSTLIFRSLGRSKSVALYEQALETAWSVITQEDLIPQAKQLIKKLEDTPEADIDDSKLPEFNAKTALSILAYSLEAAVKRNVEPAEWACSESISLRRDVDDIFIEESKRQRSIDAENPYVPGQLEVLELKHQRQSLELIKAAREPNAELLSSLRRLSQEASKDLEAVVSELRKQQGK